jgi:hypothetical protein
MPISDVCQRLRVGHVVLDAADFPVAGASGHAVFDLQQRTAEMGQQSNHWRGIVPSSGFVGDGGTTRDDLHGLFVPVVRFQINFMILIAPRVLGGDVERAGTDVNADDGESWT